MARPSQSRHPNQRQRTTRQNVRTRSSCQQTDRHLEPRQTCTPKDRCRSGVRDDVDLRCRFLAILQQSDAPDWKSIWELFVTHPWFLSRLQQCSRTVVRRASLSSQLAEDVQQEVLLKFAAKLQRMPDLSIDLDRAATHFAGWMHTIILRECQMVVRTLRRLHGRMLPLLTDKTAADAVEQRDARIDLHEALSHLDPDDECVLLLHLDGWAVKEIAEALNVSLSSAYRTLRRANERLERKLRR